MLYIMCTKIKYNKYLVTCISWNIEDMQFIENLPKLNILYALILIFKKGKGIL